jgi:RNA polymerase sigma-70 factor (ECF subfamily)
VAANDDRALVEAATRGDAKAFEVLYRRHRGYVLSVAARYGATGQDALDVLQETFFYFFRKLPGFELRSQFRTFLYPAVKHLALKKKDRHQRHVPLDAVSESLANIPSPESESRQRLQVAEIVAGLPERQREVLMLRFVDGFKLGEIAEALGVPTGTVKSRLHNALAALRGEES